MIIRIQSTELRNTMSIYAFCVAMGNIFFFCCSVYFVVGCCLLVAGLFVANAISTGKFEKVDSGANLSMTVVHSHTGFFVFSIDIPIFSSHSSLCVSSCEKLAESERHQVRWIAFSKKIKIVSHGSGGSERKTKKNTELKSKRERERELTKRTGDNVMCSRCMILHLCSRHKWTQ